MEDLISIIIPTYNVENYVHRGIESCIKQEYLNIEIIIVDDGSSDKTVKIVDYYAAIDKRIKVYKKRNGGVSSARNLGIKKATGKYVLFLDSDDWLEKDCVIKLLDMQEKGNGKLVAVDRYWVKEKCDGLIKKVYPSKKGITAECARMEALKCVGSGKYNLQSACYKLFSLDIIRKNNIMFDERFYYGEDGLFVFQYIEFSKGILYSSIPLWNIFERPGSATKSTFNTKMLTALNCVDEMLDISISQSQDLSNLYNYGIERCKELITSCISSPEMSKQVQNSTVQYIRGKMKEYYLEYSYKRITMKLNYCVFYYWPLSLLYRYTKDVAFIKSILKNYYYRLSNNG